MMVDMGKTEVVVPEDPQHLSMNALKVRGNRFKVQTRWATEG
jgi:hypothetical protein